MESLIRLCGCTSKSSLDAYDILLFFFCFFFFLFFFLFFFCVYAAAQIIMLYIH